MKAILKVLHGLENDRGLLMHCDLRTRSAKMRLCLRRHS